MSALPSWDELKANGFAPDDHITQTRYQALRHAEAAAPNDLNRIYVRIVGHLLLVPFLTSARPRILLEVSSCLEREDPNTALYELGALYSKLITVCTQCHPESFVRALIIAVRKKSGTTPLPSEHPSRIPFILDLEDNALELVQSPRDHSTAKGQALRRDNFSCMVTGMLDLKTFSTGRRTPAQGQDVKLTQCCHIFPASLGDFGTKNPGDKKNDVATVWTLLERFGYTDIAQQLRGPNLHRLENVMTLTTDLQDLMDNLQLWFEAVEGQQHGYHIRLARPLTHTILHIERQVQFVASGNWPLPDPEYLRIHAACCQVAHLSGAAEYFDTIDRDTEELPVLASDGSSSRVLEFALQRLITPG